MPDSTSQAGTEVLPVTSPEFHSSTIGPAIFSTIRDRYPQITTHNPHVKGPVVTGVTHSEIDWTVICIFRVSEVAVLCVVNTGVITKID